MKILFLGDIVGPSGCMVLEKYLMKIVKENKINFVIANGENAAHNGVGITKDVLFSLTIFIRYFSTTIQPEGPTMSPKNKIFIYKFFFQ